MDFEIIGEITQIETICHGSGVQNREQLQCQYTQDRWRKLRGIASVHLVDNSVRFAEIHWYQTDSIDKIEFKLKLLFSD